ncbi:hypothetical protein M9Y10_013856 [Tritrichomonas musculus]|uniref:Uncharacterized protein n=1 Tax=Tritrichomonas musculus TaxID=1915356 RepID=A0ABR2L171_9EUKA
MPDDHSSLNFAEILYPYLTNWRVIKKDGTETNKNITISTNDYSFEKFDEDGATLDRAYILVGRPDDVITTNALYVLVDLDINGDITTLQWDCNQVNAVLTGFMNVYGNNPCIEFFKYMRTKRHSIKTIEGFNHKNIRIYMEKEFFCI